jgi:hypothetical protein
MGGRSGLGKEGGGSGEEGREKARGESAEGEGREEVRERGSVRSEGEG